MVVSYIHYSSLFAIKWHLLIALDPSEKTNISPIKLRNGKLYCTKSDLRVESFLDDSIPCEFLNLQYYHMYCQFE